MSRNSQSCWRTGLLALGLGLAIAAALPQVAFGQDSLETLRENVREGPSSDEADSAAPPGDSQAGSQSNRPKPSEQPHSLFGGNSSCGNSSTDCDDDTGLIILAGIGITSPFWGPFAFLEGGEGRDLQFPSFPYDGATGFMQAHDATHDGWLRPRKSRNWAGRFSFEAGDSLTSDQNWLGGRGLIETRGLRLGLDFDLRHWQQVAGLTAGDQLWLGKSDVTFRIAQSEHWLFRTGLGVNWLSDAAATNAGFNFTYGIDWFPVKPLVFTSEIDLGTLGEAWLFHARTSAGLVIRGTEVYLGYDYYDIGDAQLNGLSTGVRLWF